MSRDTCGTHPQREPKIFVLLCDILHTSVRQNEFECGDSVYCETILVGLPRISWHVGIALSECEARRVPTSTKGNTTHADTVDATPNNIETFGDKVRVYIGPGKSRPNFDNPLFLIEDDVSEMG